MPPKKRTAEASSTSKNPKSSKSVKKTDAPAGEPGKIEPGSGDRYKTALLATLKDEGWKKALAAEFSKPYFDQICAYLQAEKNRGAQVFPPEDSIFNAFNYCPLDSVRVVILGQDPYHDDGQAHGLCFSVQKGINPPPSLVNIYKELSTDIPGFKTPDHGYLEAWARQGVLLLNATLTVRAHEPNSHKDIGSSHSSQGWQTFTDAVISYLNKEKEKKKAKSVDEKKHCVLKAAHPSPLSVKSFLGCKVFSKTNEYLTSTGQRPIDWQLPLTL